MMVSTTTKSLLLFSFVITAATSSSSSSSSSSAVRNRRLLHQPFFPLSTAAPPTHHPPSLPPQPQTQPKYRFSTTPKAQQKPFFPYFPSLPPPTPPPPPPSVSSLATFPANISSLLFPHLPPSSISRRHHYLITTVFISLSILFATILAALSGFFVYSRRRRGHHHHTATISEKTSSRSDSLRLFPPNAISSDGSPKPPKLPHHPGVSNTSSEFLYLGTLANSRNGLEDHQKATNSSNAGITIGVSSPAYQKLGSPELKPLPPLPRHNYTPSYRSGEALLGSSKEGEADTETDDDEGEQFFSPRGSSGQKECLQESQLPIGSSSRRELQGLQGENFGSTSFNSRTASYPYSNSVSRANSVSTSPSAVSSSSRISPKSKSQNSTQFIAGILGQNEQSPTRFESVVGVTNLFVQMGLCPPPPRPPPLPRFWDISSGVARDLNWMSSGQPMLVRPSKRVLVHNGESSLTCDQLHPNSSVERSEEAPKPKLKPLHWDKVVGSSDRGMVWDQLKSSTFQ